jgi:hypothetical protein
MITATPLLADPDPSACFWASVVRKVVQRGTRPQIHHPAIKALAVETPTTSALLAAIAGPVVDDWALDEGVELHPVFERPFWHMLAENAPHIRRWCTPQAWLEGLAGRDDIDTQRWVDFLIHVPWLPSAGIIEIDGSGHVRQPGVDRERDRELEAADASVKRITGPDARRLDNPVVARLIEGRPPWLGIADPSLLAAVHGPAALHRFAYAMAESVERGFLRPGEDWHISLSDSLGVVDRMANIAIDLVSPLAEAWNLKIVPERVQVNGDSWERTASGRFALGSARSEGEPSVVIVLDPFTPAHAALPSSHLPTIVMRGCLLPVDLQWTPTTSVEGPGTGDR